MASRNYRATVTPAPNDVVDLTADSDPDDVSTASEDSPPVSRQPSSRRSRSGRVAEWQQAAYAHERREANERLRRQTEEWMHLEMERLGEDQATWGQQDRNPLAPPFVRRPQGQRPGVIVLSDDSEESDLDSGDFDIPSDVDTGDSESVATIASPEVQFVEERRVEQPRNQRPEVQVNVPRLDRGGPFGYLPEILSRGTQLVFGNMQNAPRNYNEGFLDRLDGVPQRQGVRQGNDNGDALNVIMDYARPAFAMGNFDVFDRSSETPQVVQEPYKAPPPAKEGFTRTFGEEDVILCPMCGDELAIGKGDVKQQVWVVKGCGHVSDYTSRYWIILTMSQVYCGECATNRSKTKSSRKGKGKENEKKLESVRSVPFSLCQIEGCNTKLASKTAMFPIYL